MKGRKYVVYLGGNLNLRSYKEAKKERDYVRKELEKTGRIKVLDPLRGKKQATVMDLKGVIKQKGCVNPELTVPELIGRDKRDLQKSDLLIILTADRCTDGSWLEFGFMRYKLDRPVVLVAPSRKGSMSWSDYEASAVYTSVNEMIGKVINYWSVE